MAMKKSAARGILPPTANATKLSSSTKDTTATAEAISDEKEATPYSQALSRLEPLLPILQGIAHRNHNQHRRAAWWRHFGLLRRNCARLVEVLVEAVAAAQKNAARAAKASKAKSKKRRREELASGGVGAGARENQDANAQPGTVTDENIFERATWIRDVLVPKCYLAFSQLTADTQFAPIGIVLLGILAQLQAACDIVVPRPAPSSTSAPNMSMIAEPQPSAVENTTTAGNSILAFSSSENQSKMNESRMAPGEASEDRNEKVGGKAISREAVERAAAQHKKDEEPSKAKGKLPGPTDQATSTMPSSEASTAPTTLPSTKRQVSTARESGAHTEVPRPAKKMKTLGSSRDGEKGSSADKDKKKKKAKKGDAFDDLFKSLI